MRHVDQNCVIPVGMVQHFQSSFARRAAKSPIQEKAVFPGSRDRASIHGRVPTEIKTDSLKSLKVVLAATNVQLTPPVLVSFLSERQSIRL
jgi:hypothetical protein